MINASVYGAIQSVVLRNFQFDSDSLVEVFFQRRIIKKCNLLFLSKHKILNARKSLNLKQAMVLPNRLNRNIVFPLFEVELKLTTLPEIKFVSY